MVVLNEKNYKVIGGAGKLFNHFLKEYNPTSLISYCDVRFFDGKVYEKIGMEYSHSANPNYYYFHKNDLKRFSRVVFQKHKQENRLEKFDELLSEEQNMKNNGYFKIYDCGNKVFVWKTQTLLPQS